MSLAQEFDGLAETAHETIVDLHGESQRDRVVGYLNTQALCQIMEYLDPEDIIEVKGRRRVNETATDITKLEFSGAEEWVTLSEKRREILSLTYERDARGPLPWDEIQEGITNSELLGDIPIDRLAFKFEDSQLQEHLWEHIQETLSNHPAGAALQDPGAFKQPFIAVMESSPPGTDAAKRDVEDDHPGRYWLAGDKTDENGRRGLGWRPRTLDLTAIWSRRSYRRANDTVARSSAGKVTLREVEEAVFNRVREDEPVYGAVNSKLAVNKWRSALTRGCTGMKAYQWLQTEGWVLANGGDA